MSPNDMLSNYTPSFFSFISLFQIFATEITNLIAKTEELNSKCLIVV